ncbi:hypothetical protein LRR80_06191 [Streptomyces sp. RO-S4]|nr:hypothetical protein [Streptomyces sp. RO-S4]
MRLAPERGGPAPAGGAGRCPASTGGAARAPERTASVPAGGAVRADTGGGRTGTVMPCTPAAGRRPRRRVVPRVPGRAASVRARVPRVRTRVAVASARRCLTTGTAGGRTGEVPERAASVPAGRAGAAGCRTGEVVPCAPATVWRPCRRVVPCTPVRDGARAGGGAVRVGAGGPAPGGAGAVHSPRVVLVPGGRTRPGWCWCRAGEPVPGGAGAGRGGPRRVVLGAGRGGAAPAWAYAGENRWSLMRRAAPMTPAVGPNSPRTMGRLPVARGSEPR